MLKTINQAKETAKAHPMCFPPPEFLLYEPNIACMTIKGMESGSVQDAPLKATANCAKGTSSSMILTCFLTAMKQKYGLAKENHNTIEEQIGSFPTSEPVKVAGSLATN